MAKRLLVMAAIWLVCLSAEALSQTEQVYFKFRIDSKDEVHKLTKLVSIDNVKGDTVYAYATGEQMAEFRKLGYDYTVLPNPGMLYEPIDTTGLILDWNTYPSYGAYVDSMYDFANDYPTLCRVASIGSSIQGRQILFAKLSANVDVEENEPEIMYSSTMHGDETTGFILMLKLIKYLLTNYGIDPQATYILDNAEVWINPLANPDGTYHGGNNSVFGAIRYNANGVDLNRNFPDPQDGQHPDGHTWQPETIAMMNFFDQHTFVISANFHGGAEVVNYPWDTWAQRHADDSWYIQISREYADSAQANSPSGYMNDLNNGITNGWDWYEVNGGRQDYLNYWKGDREVTIELSSTKLLPESQLDAHWNYNRAALLTFIEQTFYGIRGVVTDAVTGLPIAATMSVVGHDVDSSEVYVDPDAGDYHRMIDAGTWNLRFIAAGYVPQTVYGIQAMDYGTTLVNVQLQPLPNEPVLSINRHSAGLVDPGDTVSMTITLVNDGGGDADNVTGVLSTLDGYVGILQDSSAYPTIPAIGGLGTSLTNYVFAVSPQCPLMHQVQFRLDITAAGGYVDSAFFSITVGLSIEDFETGDFTSFPWQMGGNAPWTIVSSGVYEGTYCAKSGIIGNDRITIMFLSYDVTAAGTISFYYKVSSEAGYDFLNFYIDNNQLLHRAGVIGWTYAEYPVSPGTHIFKWEYDKDYSVSYGSDCGWIDYIIFPPSHVPLQIVTADLPDWTTGVPYSEQLEASGGVGNLTWSDFDNGLAGTGLLLSTGGLVSGVPTSPGNISFIARVVDEADGSDSRPFDFTVNAVPQILTASLPDWTVGRPYSVQLEAGGGTGTLSWSDPNNDLDGTGLSISSSGLVSGTPSQADSIWFVARVADVVGAWDESTYVFVVNPPVQILTESLPDGNLNLYYNETLVASGGTAPLAWSDRDNDLEGTGLTLSSAGVITGYPSGADTIVFIALVTDAAADTDERQFTVIINDAPFIPGDANGDRRVIGSDVTYLVAYLRGQNPPPDPFLAGDANGDCLVQGSDVIYLVNYLRGTGSAPLMGDCGIATSR